MENFKSPSSRKAGIEIAKSGATSRRSASPSSRKAGIEILPPLHFPGLGRVAFLTEGGD